MSKLYLLFEVGGAGLVTGTVVGIYYAVKSVEEDGKPKGQNSSFQSQVTQPDEDSSSAGTGLSGVGGSTGASEVAGAGK